MNGQGLAPPLGYFHLSLLHPAREESPSPPAFWWVEADDEVLVLLINFFFELRTFGGVFVPNIKSSKEYIVLLLAL